MIAKTDRIFVAGHRGLVGSALVSVLRQRGYSDLTLRTRHELDLMDESAVARFYAKERPQVVFVAAAKVGGIHANNTYGADFLHQNLKIQNNLIWGAHEADVKRLVFLGSSCIYPKLAPQPMPETCLLQGELEPTNRPYALAKIAGLELVNTLRVQYKRDWFSVMPTNLYGPRDNFDRENSHVLPALVRRFVEAARDGATELTIWGDGSPMREFMYADDCADAIVFLAERLSGDMMQTLPAASKGQWHINVGSGQEVSIADLAAMIAEVTGFKGRLRFDTTKPNGTMRKLLDTAFLQKWGWAPKMPIKEGIRAVVDWYRSTADRRD